jgi:peptidoglycan/LPS O-acetylase OafA/YrhL
VCYGPAAERVFWEGWLRPIPYFIIPSFFALSGFLVAGSLARNRIHEFLALRVLRIAPALTVEVFISAFIIGVATTTLPLSGYFSDPLFARYFFNIIGHIQYRLPGVFDGMPAGSFVNLQLWTVPYELRCYVLIVVVGLAGILKFPKILMTLLFCTPFLATAVDYRSFSAVDAGPNGTTLVLAFFLGVTLYYLRDNISFSRGLLAIALISAWACSTFVETKYIAVLPIAYATVVIGLLNPRRGLLVAGADYSYGMYLYGFPVQQTVSYFLPHQRFWYINLVLSLVGSGLLAFLSWTMVEARVLGRKREFLALVSMVSFPVLRRRAATMPARSDVRANRN